MNLSSGKPILHCHLNIFMIMHIQQNLTLSVHICWNHESPDFVSEFLDGYVPKSSIMLLHGSIINKVPSSIIMAVEKF